MEHIRNRLQDIGFVCDVLGKEVWSDRLYKYQYTIPWNGTWTIWIYSYSHWNFKFETEMSADTQGVEGWYRRVVFDGHIGEKNAMLTLEILLLATGIYEIVNRHKNQLHGSNTD